MINSIYNLFNKAIKWNAFEGFIYQTILTVHRIVLFSVVDCVLYGLQSVLFSILYLAITFFNFGFDKSQAALYSAFTKNKSNFKKIFLSQFFIQFLLITFLCCAIIFFYSDINELFSKQFKCQHLAYNQWLIIGLLLVSESVKKSLRVIGELSFLNKYIAITEVFLISIYVFLFWTSYFLGHKPTLFLIFGPHLIQSLIGVITFSFFLVNKIYNNIPENSQINTIETSYGEKTTSWNLVKQITIIRFSNFINQLSHLVFSGNLLIPFLSSTFGLERVAVLKLINDIAIYFTVIIERAFGITSAALLSHLKDAAKNVKQQAFNIATNKLFFTVFSILIVLMINSKFLINTFVKSVNVSWIAIYIFILAIVFENFFITYEQFFIVERKVYYFTAVNLVLAFLFYLCIHIVKLSLVPLLSLLLISRIVAFFIIKRILAYKLNIRLIYDINFKSIVKMILISVVLFLLLNLFSSIYVWF